MNRTQKAEAVTELQQLFEENELVVVTQYSGLTVGQMTTLRAQMRDAGASFKVTKNRLTKRALEGTRFEGIAALFSGPTAIAYSKDPVAAAKVASNFAKTNDKLLLIGGGLGKDTLDAAGINALATLPSLDELRAKLIAMISTPATRLATVAQAPAAQLARVFSAYAKTGS